IVIPILTFWILPLTLLGLLAQLALDITVAQWLWGLASWPLTQLWPALSWLAGQSWSWWEGAFAHWAAWVAVLGLLATLPFRWQVRRWLGYSVTLLVISGALWLRPSQ